MPTQLASSLSSESLALHVRGHRCSAPLDHDRIRSREIIARTVSCKCDPLENPRDVFDDIVANGEGRFSRTHLHRWTVEPQIDLDPAAAHVVLDWKDI